MLEFILVLVWVAAFWAVIGCVYEWLKCQECDLIEYRLDCSIGYDLEIRKLVEQLENAIRG